MLDPDIKAALTQAVRHAAAREILPRFRNLSAADIASKTSRHDLVTEADTRAEAFLEDRIQQILPGAFCLGEEKAAADPEILDRFGREEITVVIDPVDGTWNFAHGIASFAVIIAVMIGNQPAWGMIYDPVCDDWIEASPGEGALFKRQGGSDCKLLPCAPQTSGPASELNGFIPVRQFASCHQPELILASYQFDQTFSIRSSAHEYRMLALGTMDFSITSGTKPWDHVAGQIILAETGGASARLDGQPYDPRLNAPLVFARCPQTLEVAMAEFSFLSD